MASAAGLESAPDTLLSPSRGAGSEDTPRDTVAIHGMRLGTETRDGD